MKKTIAALALAASTASAVSAVPAAEPTADGLAWMAGTWEGTDADGTAMEEVWTEPKGGSLLGLHRDVAGGRTVSFEFLRINTETDGIVYWASPQGKPATPFRLVESTSKRVVFANPAHDFPQRILYWVDDAGALHARIEGRDAQKAMEWTWKKRAAR